ncbi:acyl-CoA dehydrogenase [Coralliovum pocilloporae]|uniref:acyl-CoA dehydrogenase n=1 Tax=Coralliovum pocilloporae TaxID=3066369 RepID=UPI003306B351
MTYRAPVDDIAHTLNRCAGLSDALQAGLFDDLSADLVSAILEEAGKFATERIAPINEIGDTQGVIVKDGIVTMPDGWKETYRDWCDAGWNSLTGPVDYDGQGLPTMLSVAVQDMWNSGSMAFGIGPTLTVGAVEALHTHASKDLQETYLPRLVSGEWMGTMNLTEPQAGSDLNALKARAERAEDGTYRIFGQKIFITYGDHDLTENIIHLVLARLPDAPPGTRGISLFLVPKVLVNADGSLGEGNDVICHSVEHKLGIHASPTCTMIFGDHGGATGWLVGEENRGLACMFTMMNNARLSVGIQGVGVAERATQHAIAYALERKQGKATGSPKDGAMDPIAAHPDVKRNLLAMQSLTAASRAICYACAHAIDMARITEGDDARFWQERANLLTPLAKAFSTDAGVEVASIGVQVHGGMGYMEETGVARLLRDARIAPIYEGTNGIQAIDLVTRKITQSDGACVDALFGEVEKVIADLRLSNTPERHGLADQLSGGLDDLRAVTDWITASMKNSAMDTALAGASPYLKLFSLVVGSMVMARGLLALDPSDETPKTRLITSRTLFFGANHLCETASLRRTIESGHSTALSLSLDDLAEVHGS